MWERVRERFRELSTSLVRDKGERLREKKDKKSESLPQLWKKDIQRVKREIQSVKRERYWES